MFSTTSNKYFSDNLNVLNEFEKEMHSVSSVSTLSSASTTSSKPEAMYEIRDCPANATKIELNFQSMTNREFLIRIETPNGESSPLLYFPRPSAPQPFIPTINGTFSKGFCNII
jgi:hypothetical protein